MQHVQRICRCGQPHVRMRKKGRSSGEKQVGSVTNGGVACRYDGTVRNATGSVIQFLYGEDGMDGTAIESQKLDNLKMKDTQFEVRCPVLRVPLQCLEHMPLWSNLYRRLSCFPCFSSAFCTELLSYMTLLLLGLNL